MLFNVFILADDLGFNDISLHGSTQIPTPFIDEIAYTGVPFTTWYNSPCKKLIIKKKFGLKPIWVQKLVIKLEIIK